MLNIELHCHTIYSKDSLTTPEEMLKACERKGLDRIAVTDHNTIRGALAVQQLDPDKVIIGEEIMTTKGELLAFFVQEEVPSKLKPEEAITHLRDQGAFISVSHPFDRLRKGHWELDDLLEILPNVDAIETFNSRCLRSSFNKDAQAFSKQHNLQQTVGSDAHAVYELGKARLIVPEFEDAESFSEALETAKQEVTLSPFWVHFYSRYAVWRKKLDPNLVP